MSDPSAQTHTWVFISDMVDYQSCSRCDCLRGYEGDKNLVFRRLKITDQFLSKESRRAGTCEEEIVRNILES